MTSLLIDDFDSDSEEILQPDQRNKPIANFPKIIIAPFYGDMVQKFAIDNGLPIIGNSKSLNGSNYVYRYQFHDLRLGLIMAPVGAPQCIETMEDLRIMGATKFITFGTCGVLDTTIGKGKIAIPSTAVRDEGTSYHYQPASETIQMPKKTLQIIQEALNTAQIPYMEGKTWTTDAIYRETKNIFQKRKRAGCSFVDIEASAILAWSKFRQIEAYPFFTTADNLDSKMWEVRSDYRDDIPTALKAALAIARLIN
ncbi:purine phosphorylase family 1 [Companilactobacillus versmoldensis DSM 14857 = KCTC 3814]|uniref:Uridine phosphorylase n=1 Tax=Companilactobacillus versmoldensis DSM 14857 = KCTC 3814 TaxID=1423815 RepID=A0A0R1SFK4_9LACO|nr:purine phosphorylase family 1 [Companilactobacillus versmoldensis DSM 14857 = KCTC 3814]